MNIAVECDCGNKICVPVLSEKAIVVRDNLQNKFDLIDIAVEKNCLKEIQIQCKKCKDWITLNFD